MAATRDEPPKIPHELPIGLEIAWARSLQGAPSAAAPRRHPFSLQRHLLREFLGRSMSEKAQGGG